MDAIKKTIWLSGLAVTCLIPAISFAQQAQPAQQNIANNAGQNNPVIADAESEVMADACYSLNENEQWKELFSRFTDAYQNKDYDRALSYMGDLQAICDRSPVLNFSIAMTYREMGNNEEALKFITKATSNKEFAVSPEMQKKFWYAQYEIDNAALICEQKDLDACESSRAEVQTKYELVTLGNANLLEDMRKRDKAIMWTGIGFGIAGVAIAGAGAGIFFPNRKIESFKDNTAVASTGYVAGLTMVGVGIGAAVVGAVVAGIAGYNYTHATDNYTASWSVSPTNVEFGLTF